MGELMAWEMKFQRSFRAEFLITNLTRMNGLGLRVVEKMFAYSRHRLKFFSAQTATK